MIDRTIPPEAIRTHRGALKIAGMYMLIGVLWILFSDSFVGLIATSPSMYTTLSVIKGWGYVILTGILLYWLIRGETDAIREREAQLRLVADAVPAMIAYINADRSYNFINRAYQEWFGVSTTQAVGKCIDDVIGPETYQEISGHVDTVLAGQPVSFEQSMTSRASEVGFFQVTYVPDFADDGQVKGYFSLSHDITSRKQVEADREQLLSENQRQKALLDAIFEADPSGLAVLAGTEMTIVYANPAYHYMTPDLSIDPIGQAYETIWPPERGVGYHQQIREVLENGRPFKSNRFERVFPDGTRRIFNFQGRRIEWDGQLACLLTLWDVTEQEEAQRRLSEELTQRRQAEVALAARNEEIKTMTQQLWQASKLATMGELAASVAHEINNPLAILSLRVENLDCQLPEAFPGRSDLTIIAKEIDRMAGIVSNLLQFSRPGERHLSSLNIVEEIDNTLELVHAHLINRKIQVREEISPQTPLVIADRQQMRQLFLNLFTNASDAMPDGGTLDVKVSPRQDASQVQIELEDSGVGIDPEDLPRVVEPFFSTKPEGKGTGLGLAICRRIVEEHQGSFQVTSPGKDRGTTIHITLPHSSTKSALADFEAA